MSREMDLEQDGLLSVNGRNPTHKAIYQETSRLSKTCH